MCKRAYKHKLCIFAEIAKFEQCILSHVFILLSKWQFSILSKSMQHQSVKRTTILIFASKHLSESSTTAEKKSSLELLHSLICIPILVADLQLIKWCNASFSCKRRKCFDYRQCNCIVWLGTNPLSFLQKAKQTEHPELVHGKDV